MACMAACEHMWIEVIDSHPNASQDLCNNLQQQLPVPEPLQHHAGWYAHVCTAFAIRDVKQTVTSNL